MSLPASWIKIQISELASKITDGEHLRPNIVEKGIPFISAKDIAENDVDFSRCLHVSQDDANIFWRKCKPEQGDLLVVSRGAVGHTVLIRTTKQFTLLGSVILIKLIGLVNPAFCVYYLSMTNTQRKLMKLSGSTVQGAIYLRDIKNIDIPLAPLPEQHRIVAKIEELFSDLDAAVASLKKAKEQLKTYRQSVLKWAFEGKLTNKNTKEGKLPDGWNWKYSKDLFEYVTSGSRGWAQYYSAEGAIFLRMGNLDHDSINLDLSDIQYVQLPNKAEGTRTLVHEGDILISITADVGMIAMVPNNFPEAYINQHVSLARPKKEIVQSSYLAWYLASNENGQKQFRALQRGATKVGLGLDDIKSINVPIPPIPEQSQIVSEIESRLSVADNLEKTIDASLTQANALRQSILKRAFEGKLVSQDPKDEPAEKLLERIKAARHG